MQTTGEKMEEAMQLEAHGALAAAEQLYLQAIRAGSLNELAFRRLMVIYRKQKAYRKELAIVDKAIKAFEAQLAGSRNTWSAAHKKAARISRALAKSLGMLNRKGLPANEDPLLINWRKRKANLQRLVRKTVQKRHKPNKPE